jgi:hypothetical protein
MNTYLAKIPLGYQARVRRGTSFSGVTDKPGASPNSPSHLAFSTLASY